MKFLTNTLVTVTKAALKAALVVALMFGQSFFIRAQESTERIYYRFDNAVVDPSYLSNAEAFSAIDAVFAGGHSEALEIATFSSPEGNFNYNLNLSTRRANAIAKYLVARYPQLDGKISLNPNAEAWEALRAAVVADSRLSESAKAAMLQIIDSNDSADAKEKKLGALQSWKYLYSNYFRTLRYAEIRFIGARTEGADKAGLAALDAILFDINSVEVDRNFGTNAQFLDKLAATLQSLGADGIDSIEIVAMASPEGSVAENDILAFKRAQAAREYIVARFPELEGKITVRSIGETWDGLKSAVKEDATLSAESRSEILSIIDSTTSADEKEAALRNLPEWKHISEDIFPGLHQARVCVNKSEGAAMKVVPASEEDILFDLTSSEVDRDFSTNAQALDNLAATIEKLGVEGIESIEIVSQASPEGPVTEHDILAAKRAQAAYDYIVARYPELESKITMRSAGEAWDELKAAVKEDVTLSSESRSEILSIIDSTASADEKEAALRNRPEWKHLSEDIFPGLHRASVSIKKAGKAEDSVQPAKDTVKRAIPTSTEAVFFDLNSVVVDRNYGTNGEALDELISLIESRGTDEIESIEILAKTSPDGTVTVNERCAKQRGQAVYDYIVARYPELKNKVTVRSAGEAWEDLKAAVESDEKLSDSSRSKILSIIVSPADPDEKEARMRELPEWEHLLNEVFPSLRNARAEVKHKEAPAEPAMPTAQPADITVDDEPIVVADTTLRLTEDVLNIAPAPAVKYPRFAVSTNVVYDLLGVTDGFRFTPNVSLEFPIGNKWSTFIDYAFPWWVTKGNNQAWQILKWDIGSRYWLSHHNSKVPMDILSGHFVGIDLGAGYYDIEPEHKGWQGEFQTVGIEYGYAWKLGQAWRLDAYVGAGWLGTHYRYYVGDSTDQHLLYRNHGKMTWLGPTKAGISIKYIFNTERRNGR